jgi:anti-sigma factor (TIGR02949 family)
MDHERSSDCKQMFEMLSEYLDAELDSGACENLERHLADCPPCIDFINSLKRTVGACRSQSVSEAPTPLTPEQKARLLDAYLSATNASNPTK